MWTCMRTLQTCWPSHCLQGRNGWSLLGWFCIIVLDEQGRIRRAESVALKLLMKGIDTCDKPQTDNARSMKGWQKWVERVQQRPDHPKDCVVKRIVPLGQWLLTQSGEWIKPLGNAENKKGNQHMICCRRNHHGKGSWKQDESTHNTLPWRRTSLIEQVDHNN